ncbi:MAG: transglycosylase domain-containing protein [bacterium]
MHDWSRTWQRRKNKIKRIKWERSTVLKNLGVIALIGTLVGVFLMLILFAWYSKDLPNPNRIVRREGYSTKILDRDGNTIYDLFTDVNRVPVQLADVPLEMQRATISIEDKEFYTHQGFSTWGMIRGMLRIFTRGRAAGGSTLTQQLVKNVLLTSERSLPRKFKELVLSLQIERKFTKDEILQMYLNEAPYGGTAVGIAAAAERYFGKSTKDINLTEAAILAGMPQAPSAYSPFGSNPEAYIGRATAVLRRMREDGFITTEQEKASVEELPNVTFREQVANMRAPHFVFYVKDELVKLLGEAAVEQGGFNVTTTLDSDLQEFAQKTVTEEIASLEKQHITNGASLVMNPQNGEILAMVGSKDYFAEDYDGKVNVVMSLRQPGSAIKPVTYATAFAKGYSPSFMLLDLPTKFPGAKEGEFYEPRNYDGKFHGPVQLRFALGSSLNVPAVKLLSLVGLKDMLSMGYEMGFDSLEPTAANMTRLGLSVTLGGGEVRLLDLVRGYSAFANGGEKIEQVSILKVERDGKILYEAKPLKKKRVMSEEVAFLINHVLYDNNARLLTFGPNSYLNMSGRPIAVKTGTTNDKRDNWTVGWSTGAIVGVWVGNNDNSPMSAVTSGVSGASPIWRTIMLETWKKYKGSDFKVPSGVESRLVDSVSGYPEHDGWPARADYFAKGTVPSVPDPIHTKVKVCKSDNSKLASEVDVARGEYDEKEYYVLKQQSTAWQDDIAGWISSQTDERYKVPTEYCSSNTETVIGFDKPHNNDKLDSNNVEIRLTVVTSKEIEWVKIYVDGSEWESFTGKNISTSRNMSDGIHTLKGKVRTKDGNETQTEIKIGVKVDPTVSPSPSPSPSPVVSPSPLPSPS